MAPTATFASRLADLTVVEAPANPVFSNGRQIRVEPGKYHRFHDHRCAVTGTASIAFMRERVKAADGPGMWELSASDVREVTELLAELATADTDRVREILAEERKLAGREVVIEVCERILHRSGVSERGAGQTVVAA